jgi:hypothetical protein
MFPVRYKLNFYILFRRNSVFVTPCGGGVEFLLRSPESRRRRRKGNPMPRVQPGHPVPGEYKYVDLVL